MPKITYTPIDDHTSSTPETERMFNTGSRVIIIYQGDNWIDEATLITLESLPTFLDGVDKWFIVDRSANPPQEPEQLTEPEDLELITEEG